MARWKGHVSILFLSLAAGAIHAQAQTTTATLRGNAADEQRAVLPGVTITALQVDTNTSHTVVSAKLGEYSLPQLPPGLYEVSAGLPGFRAERRTNLMLQIGQEVTIDFVLRVSGLKETVVVRAEAPILATTVTTIGSIVNTNEIDDLPTVERDFSSLARIAPGVAPGVGGNGDSLSMNGQRGFSNGFFIDGATAEWQYYGKQSTTLVQDWIQEFQVMTNSFSAEFGTASGGIVNVITRSGTNRFQGRAYGFFRDGKLDSAPFAGSFTNGHPDYLDEAAPFSQQRIGGFLGGPIVRDKLFFFSGVEELTKHSSETLGISDYWRAQGIKTVLPSGTNDHPYLVKADVNVTKNHQLSARYDRSVRKDLNQSQAGAPIDTEEDRYTFGGPIWNLVGNYRTTISNISFNEARAFYGSNKAPIVCNKSGTGGSAELAKAPIGTFAHIEYPGALFGCPIFDGLEGEENIVLTDTVTFSKGHHQVKVGAQANQVRTIIDATNFNEGYWSHPIDRLFDRSDPTTYPDTFTGIIAPTLAKWSQWNSYYYVQDTWRASNSLTLNLGLRYDIDRSATAGNDLVDAKNARIVQRYGGAPLLQKARVDDNNVAPRLGFAWTPTQDRRTTIRGSGGVFYDQNHNNFNAIYIGNTLLSDGFTSFSANDPLANPFFHAQDPAGSAVALRAFLARNYPYFPDLSLAPVAPESVDRLDPALNVASTVQFTGGVGHDFGHGLTVSADYVHTDGIGMPVFLNDNVTFANGVYVSTDPRFAHIATLKSVGTSRYDALLTQTHYRSKNAHAGVSYTLSKATSNNEATIFDGSATNPFDLSEDEGPDNTDRRHNLVVNGSYLFPLDIQLAGIAIYRSAVPYSVSTRFQLDADPFRDRPEPRNSRRGDSESTVDVRLSKTVRIGLLKMTGFWEMFNAFNTDNFTDFAGSLESPSFGQPLAALDKRRQQFGFRIDF